MRDVVEDLAAWPAWVLPVAAAYTAFLVAIAVHDIRRHRVPNVAVYPAILAGLGLAFIRPDGPWWTFVAAGAGAGALFVVLGVVSGDGMGMGDAKLATFIGLMTGWPGVLAAGFIAFAVGATCGILLVALGRLGRRDPLPFAPALAVGALVAAVAGDGLAAALWPGIAG